MNLFNLNEIKKKINTVKWERTPEINLLILDYNYNIVK
jgi:hypothetical protein